MRTEQEVPQGERVKATFDNVRQVHDVALRLCYLCALELQMSAMHPEAREWPLARGGFGLRYFVVVMYRNVLHTARMDVYLCTERRAYHRGTLDVPAGEDRKSTRLNSSHSQISY